jgi:hypothetical protein
LTKDALISTINVKDRINMDELLRDFHTYRLLTRHKISSFSYYRKDALSAIEASTEDRPMSENEKELLLGGYLFYGEGSFGQESEKEFKDFIISSLVEYQDLADISPLVTYLDCKFYYNSPNLYSMGVDYYFNKKDK